MLPSPLSSTITAADVRYPPAPEHHSTDGNTSVFLGVSSNWSFGRRVLSIVHERIYGAPAAADASLLFEGSTYDLGWNGQRTADNLDTSIVPDADYALFLINAVKFHCGQLFHLFDEPSLMQNFDRFYEDRVSVADQSRAWYVQLLLVLALGKSCVLHTTRTKRSPGSDLFVQAIQLLPNITTAWDDPLQSLEIFCMAALFYQCLDMRSAAYNVVSHQALRRYIKTDT